MRITEYSKPMLTCTLTAVEVKFFRQSPSRHWISMLKSYPKEISLSSVWWRKRHYLYLRWRFDAAIAFMSGTPTHGLQIAKRHAPSLSYGHWYEHNADNCFIENTCNAVLWKLNISVAKHFNNQINEASTEWALLKPHSLIFPRFADFTMITKFKGSKFDIINIVFRILSVYVAVNTKKVATGNRQHSSHIWTFSEDVSSWFFFFPVQSTTLRYSLFLHMKGDDNEQ